MRFERRTGFERLVILSPGGGFRPVRALFHLRAVPVRILSFLPKWFFEHVFWRYVGRYELYNAQTRTLDNHVSDLIYLGLRYFRAKWIVQNVTQQKPQVFPDMELRGMHAPTLPMIGQKEMLYDAAAAMERAKKLVPNLDRELVPRVGHDMTMSQHELVDRRILNLLNE